MNESVNEYMNKSMNESMNEWIEKCRILFFWKCSGINLYALFWMVNPGKNYWENGQMNMNEWLNNVLCKHWLMIEPMRGAVAGECLRSLLKNRLASLEHCLSDARQCLSNDREHPPVHTGVICLSIHICKEYESLRQKWGSKRPVTGSKRPVS